jgi:hypothetical protein
VFLCLILSSLTVYHISEEEDEIHQWLCVQAQHEHQDHLKVNWIGRHWRGLTMKIFWKIFLQEYAFWSIMISMIQSNYYTLVWPDSEEQSNHYTLVWPDSGEQSNHYTLVWHDSEEQSNQYTLNTKV